MAVTRATSKVCRVAFSWVMVLAGYEATPSEEMPRETEQEPVLLTKEQIGEVKAAALKVGAPKTVIMNWLDESLKVANRYQWIMAKVTEYGALNTTAPAAIEEEDKATAPGQVVGGIIPAAMQEAMDRLAGMDANAMRGVVLKAASAEKIGDKALGLLVAQACDGDTLVTLRTPEDFARVLVAISRRQQLALAETLVHA